MTFIEVNPTQATRDHLSPIVEKLAQDGIMAKPVVVGPYRSNPKGVIVSFALLQQVADRIPGGQDLQSLEALDVELASQTREAFTRIVDGLPEQGADAKPVVFGRRRKPEAAIISWELFTKLLADLDAAQAQHESARRLGMLPDSDPEQDVRDFCEAIGVDPEKARLADDETSEVTVTATPPWVE